MEIIKDNVKDDWQERLIEEFEQLNDRIEKLENAINTDGFVDKVGERQFFLMGEQLSVMKSYSSTLGKRLLDLNLAK